MNIFPATDFHLQGRTSWNDLDKKYTEILFGVVKW